MNVSGDSVETHLCRVRVLTTISELDAVADAWHGLWARCERARTPYLSFEWVRTWAGHFGQDGRLFIILVEDDETILGIMPLTLVRYRLWPFTLEALETVGGESRNLIALVAPGSGAVVAGAVADYLASEVLSAGRALRLSLVPSSHPFLQLLVSALEGIHPRISMRVRLCNFAPYTPLPALWEDFERSLGRRRRKVLARAQSRLDLSRREVRIRQWHGDEIDDAMRRLFDVHDARWEELGIRGLFHDERNRAFHLDIARQCDRMGWLDLSELEVDGKTASAYFVLVLDGVSYMMRSGRDTSFAGYDVGHLHDLRLFRMWIARGLREADFLRGAEPYKFYWTSHYRVYMELLAVGSRQRGGMPLCVARTWMRIARFISHRHPPREVLAYLRQRRMTRSELRKMNVTLRA